MQVLLMSYRNYIKTDDESSAGLLSTLRLGEQTGFDFQGASNISKLSSSTCICQARPTLGSSRLLFHDQFR